VRDDPVRRETLAVALVCVLGGAAWAFVRGQDLNYDQLNYHTYTSYAWLTGRTLTDLAAAQIQTWLNPVLYVPGFLLIRYTPPVVAGMTMGALTALNGVLLWILARRLTTGYAKTTSCWCSAFAAFVGVSGSMFLSFLGTTFGECLPPVLAAVILVVSDAEDWPRGEGAKLLGAGCCLGLACGVKLTNLVYALGMTVTLMVLWPFLRFRALHLLGYAAGGVVGFAVSGGYWAAKLWTALDNPVFPFFNGIFRSVMYEPVNFQDPAYIPSSLARAAVVYPFEWLLGFYRPSNPLFFREPRFALIAVLLPVALAAALARAWPRPSADPEREEATSARNFWILCLFFLFSYGFWLTRFGVQRYLLVLEVLSGVLLLVVLGRMLRSGREVGIVMAGLAVAVVLWTRPTDWGHGSYEASWYGITHAEDPAARTLYVMVGGEPMAYVIPYLPENARFVRVGGTIPFHPAQPMGLQVARVVYQHDGPVRSLTVATADHQRARLAEYGLQLDAASCRRFRSRLDTFWTCALAKTPASWGAP